MDESGDLGFKQFSSGFFTIAFVFTINRYPSTENKTVRKTIKDLNSKRTKRQKIIEFKFTNDSDVTRKRFLNKIKSMDLTIGVITITKDSVIEELKADPARLYRYLVVENIISFLAEEYLKPWDPYNSISFVIDRSLSKSGIREFNKYCEGKLSYKTKMRDRYMESNITIRHEDSKAVSMLQVSDYIAGSVQRKFEHDNSEYYEIIKSKIKYFREWDWKDKIEW